MISTCQPTEHNFIIQKIDGEAIKLCTKCGETRFITREKYPLDAGERDMWAVLGQSGGIYGFATSAWKAKEMQKDYYNIGDRAPIRYRVKFIKI